MSDPLVGDRFRIGRRLGSGGTAVVYEAVDGVTGRPVAVKLLHSRLAADRATWDAFFEEVAASSAIAHRGVVEVIDWGVSFGPGEPAVWIAMELVRGLTLSALVAARGPLSVAQVREVGDGLLDVLESAHAAGVVHRDISPSNVMIDPDAVPLAGSLRLLDFGLADIPGRSTHGADPLLSAPGRGVVANAPYASPEHLTGASVVEESDVYQVGATLWFALTGSPPFTGPTERVVRDHLSAPLPRLRDSRPDVPKDLERALRRALSKSPAERGRAAALRSALGAAAVAPVAQPPVDTRTLAWRSDDVRGATALLPGMAGTAGAVQTASRRRPGRRLRPIGWMVVVGGGALLAGVVALSAAATPTGLGGAPAASVSSPPTATPSATPTPTGTTGAGVLVVVPDTRGLSSGDATAALAAVGLRAGGITVVDAVAAADTVVDTRPAPGARAAASSSVELTVASGEMTVPDLSGGIDVATAQARLSAAGFTGAVGSGSDPNGRVTAWTPTGRTAIGTQILLSTTPLESSSSPTPTASASAQPSPSPSPSRSPSPRSTP